MPLPTTHPGPDEANVTIDRELCTSCGACAKVCFGKPLELIDGRVDIDPTRLFGCIACGACMTVCPTGAIRVTGRDLSCDDLRELPPAERRAGYDELMGLLRHRRSVRRFTSEDVSAQDVDRILAAAATAPMGVPPSEVGILVLEGRERVQAFAAETVEWLSSVRRWVGPLLPLARPFLARDDYALLRDFVIPALDAYAEKKDEGVDWLTYDAPLLMLFYGTGVNDPADPYIPATLAVVAAESLGLGTCMLGFAGYAAFYSKRFRERWGLPKRVRPGIAVVFGHPAVRHRHAIERRFSAVVRG